MSGRADVAVIGAGVIGLSVAWRCAQRGLAVTVLDPRPGSGATWTAAGMLAPVAELAEITGLDVGYRRCGTVQAAWDAADLAGLRDLHAFQKSLGISSQLLTGRELREAEPMLAAGLPGGLWAADDHQVDNRLLHGALERAAAAAGVRVVRARIDGWLLDGDRVTGVRTDDGQRVGAASVVLAAGAWSAGIAGLPAGSLPPVRPVKGQTLRLRGPRELLGHVVRGAVRGSPVYVVPRGDGRLVVGASSEEAGFDLRPRAGAVYELLRDAQLLIPALGEAEFDEVSTSLRPGSPDNLPMIGPASVPGLVMATGHYRNGILLAPLTADAVADLLTGGDPGPGLAACDPRRFDLAATPEPSEAPA
jgi:glycine oxidase